MPPSDKDLRQAEYLSNRILKNRRLLSKWVRSNDIHAYRLYDRDIPEVPLALDYYGSDTEKALVMALYERPYDKSDEDEAAWLSLMAESAGKSLEIPSSRIFARTRRRMKGLSQYEREEEDGFATEVRESGLAFKVVLSGRLDTGLFLDHRQTRQLVRSASCGKKVLNLFSYTGSFSVYAAAGGAETVTSVDLSNTYLAWSKDNFRINNLPEERHSAVRSDALRFLHEARAEGSAWEMIIADPPTFSNSAKTTRDFDVNRDWPVLLEACRLVLAPDGVIVFSSNSRSLKWNSELVRLPVKEITDSTLPPDFRNRRIHRCWLAGNYTSSFKTIA